jgi:putative ATPase
MHLQNWWKNWYGEEYKYSHDYQNNFADQEYLPEALKYSLYVPGNNSEKTQLENF